jgi:large subunit ribosomal protein L17
MRHAKRRLQLNRFTSWHKATLKSMASNLLIYQSVKTSLDKAKAVRPLVERLVTLAKTGTLSAKRQAYKILCDHKLVSVLFSEIAPLFAHRQSGFTRIIQLGRRRGDNAKMVIFELTEIKKKEVKKAKKTKEALLQHKDEPGPVKGEPKEAKEPKAKPDVAIKEKPPIEKKPTKKFLGGLRNIFKKERDSL